MKDAIINDNYILSEFFPSMMQSAQISIKSIRKLINDL